jgi:hypothetical protein
MNASGRHPRAAGSATDTEPSRRIAWIPVPKVCPVTVRPSLETNPVPPKENPMKTLQSLLIGALLLVVSATASAGEFTVLKDEITAARASLVNMVTNRGKRGPAEQKLVKETAEAVSVHLSRLKAPQGKATEFQELKETWNAFKSTRENELVPAILANETEKVTRLGAVIQKARLERMYALIQILDK